MNGNIPDHRKIEMKIKILNIVLFTILYLVILLDIGIILFQIIYKNEQIGLIVSLILPALFSLSIISNYFTCKKNKLKKYKNGIGRYTQDKISLILEECFYEFKGREIPSVYIIPDKYESPKVIDSLFLNFLKPLNAIYIPEYIFYILKEDEIKATMYHELGHFYKYINPISRCIYPLNLFIFLFMISIFKVTLVIFFIGFMLMAFFYNFIISKLQKFQSINYEYLADFYAAKKYGAINMINSIISINKFFELLGKLQYKLLFTIKNNDKLLLKNFEKIFEDAYDDILNKLKEKESIDIKLKDILEMKIIKKYEKKVLKLKLYFDKKKFENYYDEVESHYKSKNLIDWEKFDNNNNFRIDEEEYDRIIDMISKNDEIKFFDNIGEEEEFNKTHPIIAKRLLFLHKNLNK